MDKLQRAVAMLHEVDSEAGKGSSKSRIHPASRLIVCILFILITVSFPKYNIMGLLSMWLYLFITGIWEELSFWKGLKRIRYILLLIVLLGLANLFFDRAVIFRLGSINVTSGMVSMATLLIKGIMTVYAAYFLLMETGIEGICAAFRTFGVPKGGVTVILLIYRYLILLLKEVQRMSQAYQLRAPGQKGIHIRTWGSFVGLLLLRTMERAGDIYDSMLLRGYHGEYMQKEALNGRINRGLSCIYVAAWAVVLAFLRVFPVFQMVGNLLG
ncbi:MAG: energy-coupling factor transporter transmembrane protein EcfT [Roseburia sp.]|nr:energy-coupling factor transporter transmembrane protein EcfT [Roseburia sp.]MCM1278706.1 energy-coupling factor transporter transmembrane protein EcfT [Robinsoniella sp.]